MSNSEQQKPFEKENYPILSEIIYYGDQKFTYVIIQEGTYPPTVNYTEAPNYFPILDNYIIKTT
jgi:beta-mannanase